MSSVISIWLPALPALVALAVVAWVVASARRNVGLVDVFWSLFLLLAAVLYWAQSPRGLRAGLVVALTAAWALRLAIYLAWRNWSSPEDRRYQAIRRRNEPGFAWKSLYLVFGLQAALAWLVSAPLAAAITGAGEPGWLELAGATLVIFGIAYEATADAQLARYRSRTASQAGVMDRGLWRYSRHPNYFGEFCVWWGFYLLAVAAGGWWTVFSPALMSVLLLKVSGVGLLERDIAERRPAYRDYVRRTNAFFPGRPRTS
jgi:steroid 5-alpha reductase family enzyme